MRAVIHSERARRISSITGCLIVQLCVGIIYLWSIFKTPIANSFGCSAADLNMVSSYMLTAFVVGCFLGGILNDRHGPRSTCLFGIQLFSAGMVLTAALSPSTIKLISFTYACLGGLGSGLSYSACVSCVQKWLPDRRGLATGLAVSAFGLSTVIFAPVSQAIMGAFTDAATYIVNFRGVFATLALIFLALGLIACQLIHLPVHHQATVHTSTSGTDLSISQAVRTRQYWCIFFTVFFINGTWNLTVPILYDLGIDRGLSAALATFAVSFTGIPNAFGRLLMATLSDKIGRRTCTCLLAAITAAAALMMIFARGWLFIAVVAVIAFAYGGPSSVNAAMTTDYFGSRHSGTNYGVMMLALGLSSLFFNALSSTLLKGSVTLSFLIAAVSALVPIFLMKLIGKTPASASDLRYSKLNSSLSNIVSH